MEREVLKSYFEAIRLTLIKQNNLVPKFGTWIEIGTVLDHRPVKVLVRFSTKPPHSTASGNKEVTTVIAAVNVNAGKSLIYTVEILLDVDIHQFTHS